MSGWAALAQGIAQFADDAIGVYNRNTADRRAGEIAHAENKQAVLGRIEAAKAAGLHPTAVLGGSFGGSGPGPGFQSGFADLAGNLVNQHTQQRQWKQEMGMRELTEKRLATDMVNNMKLTNAQVKHIEKQSSWIDEQIKASQEQRLREANKYAKAVAGGPNGTTVTGPNGVLTEWMPNQVTRHVGGVAQGAGPWVSEAIDPATGETIRQPAGVNAESSEVWNMLRDISAHYGIPMNELTLKNTFMRLGRQFQKSKRQTRDWIRGRSRNGGGGR